MPNVLEAVVKKIDFFYLPVDVNITDHPKFLQTSEAGIGLWTLISAWSMRHGTNGKVPGNVVRTVGNVTRARPQAVASLLRAGLLLAPSMSSACSELASSVSPACGEPAPSLQDGEYVIHNFTNKVPTAEEIKKGREDTRLRVAAHRHKKRLKINEGDDCNASEVPLHPVTSNVRTLSLSMSSSLVSSEGVQGEDDQPAPSAQERYAAAYAQGISEGKRMPYAAPVDPWALGALNRAILAHARHDGQPVRGDDLLRWMSDHAHDFAHWLSKNPDRVEFYSNYGPKGFLRWLDGRSKAKEAKEVG